MILSPDGQRGVGLNNGDKVAAETMAYQSGSDSSHSYYEILREVEMGRTVIGLAKVPLTAKHDTVCVRA